MHAPDLVAQLPMVEAMARSLAARLPPPADVDELVSAGSSGWSKPPAATTPCGA